MASRGPHKKTIVEALPLRFLSARATPAALILLCVTLLGLHRLDAIPIEGMRTAVTDVMTPVLSAVSKPFSSAIESFDGVATIRSLKAENIRLQQENTKLLQWYENALKFQAENKSLRDLLNVKADPAMRFITARVVSDPGGAFVKSILLPAGIGDGITKGNAVMAGNGLVGRVTEAGQKSARVLLVTDLNSRIPVMVQNTRTRAILAGKNTDLLKLERLPADSGISVGQRIVTSGDGGQLPADIPIGTIVQVEADNVLVKPLADIGSLFYVQVVDTRIDSGLLTGEIR